ncbi:MAG: hypothetical protein HY591_04815 [Candidatus Omnitrophica bacterium]|nr:hypothetical protein [Candidatus Omnitrophota bacterium]
MPAFLVTITGHAQEAVPLIRAAIEVNAVRLILNDEHRDGVDWEAIVSDFHTLQLKKEDNPVWADKKYKISVGTVSDEDYAVLLEALDTVGKMTQAAQPPVIIEADKKQGLNMAFAGHKNDGHVRADLLLTHTSTGGPELRLEPFIGMVLKDGGNPVITTLKTQTDVPLKDNMTIVLGGIISEQEITKTHKFPLLGNLPIVGLVFRSQGRLVERTETVIFLTVRFKTAQTFEK